MGKKFLKNYNFWFLLAIMGIIPLVSMSVVFFIFLFQKDFETALICVYVFLIWSAIILFFCAIFCWNITFVHVGNDGLTIKRWKRTIRHISWSDIEDCETVVRFRQPDEAVFRLKNGKKMSFVINNKIQEVLLEYCRDKRVRESIKSLRTSRVRWL